MTDAERRRRVEDLCDAALDRDDHERAAFVAAACGPDAALRKEVESLLAHAHKSDGFLATPVAELAARVMADPHGESLVGRQFGSHRILSLLGAGGMGEVYRARDTRLGRDVAIKVVADRFQSVPGRRARFELEARVLATLNHPHIAAIYGLEEAGGVLGLVLELVEGPTLAERLAEGPVAMPEALGTARQIADALEAAHEKGIIHRDLKPANIKITSAGTVKVLDFGLAKVFAGAGSGEDAQTQPMGADASREGVIEGTAAYMSPEQARGKAVDKRTDIWAFGCVLFEMLTARPPFRGETASDTIAAILEHDADWSQLPSQTPPGIRRLLVRCLEKDPKRRLRDIGDARLDIDEATSVAPLPPSPVPEPVGPKPRRPAMPLAWLSAAAAGLLIIVSTATWVQRSEYFWRNPLEGAIHSKVTHLEGADHHAAISRDGQFVVYLSDRGGSWNAWVTQLGTGDSHNLTKGSVEELRNPGTRTLGFTPDGTQVTLWRRIRMPPPAAASMPGGPFRRLVERFVRT